MASGPMFTKRLFNAELGIAAARADGLDPFMGFRKAREAADTRAPIHMGPKPLAPRQKELPPRVLSPEILA